MHLIILVKKYLTDWVFFSHCGTNHRIQYRTRTLIKFYLGQDFHYLTTFFVLPNLTSMLTLKLKKYITRIIPNGSCVFWGLTESWCYLSSILDIFLRIITQNVIECSRIKMRLITNSSDVFTNFFHEFYSVEKENLIGPEQFFFSVWQLKKKS